VLQEEVGEIGKWENAGNGSIYFREFKPLSFSHINNQSKAILMGNGLLYSLKERVGSDGRE